MNNPLLSGPPNWYQTYRVSAPIATHWRKATCEEIDCPAYLKGWKTIVDISTDLGARQRNYIIKESHRKFKATQTGPSIIEFEFEPGQACFGRDKHRIQDRPEIYTLVKGDSFIERNNIVPFSNARDWVEDFAEHQERINARRQQS